ncbi:MAG: protein translocase subunit SecD [Patescibacteria group bacterium]
MPQKQLASTVSRSSLRWRITLIVLLAIVVAGVAYPPPANTAIDWVNKTLGVHIGHIEKGFVLGLDLQGGTRLEYQADTTQVATADKPSAMDGVRDVIERRVNTLGVSEPLVTTAQVGTDWRVDVELAGISDINQAIDLIGKTPTLVFEVQNTSTQPTSLTDDQQAQMDASNTAMAMQAKADLAKIQKDPTILAALAKASSTDAESQPSGGDLGFIKDKPEYAELYQGLETYKPGVVDKVIEITNSYVIANVLNTETSGTEYHVAHILIPYAGAEGASTSTTATKAEAQAQAQSILKQVTPQNFSDIAKKYSQEPGAAQSGGDLGWFGPGTMVQQFEAAAFALKPGQISQVVETPFGFHIIYLIAERPATDIHVQAMFYKKLQPSDILPVPSDWTPTQLTGKQLQKATVDFDQRTGAPEVSLQFDGDGTTLFADMTKNNIGKPIAIFLDGAPISIPTVQSEITGGQAVITGDYSIAEAKDLAQQLQAGALPVPIKLIEQQTVGPTLGQDSVSKSLTAGLFAVLFITIFMLFWYRAPGFFSILSLGLYVGISFTIFKLLPVTLTLAGIGGFILSLGIAVDANVLVYERLKEELRSGKPYRTALEEAFKRAWPSIFDGNMTTIISSAVLYWFSSSIIKGFALTLAIGVIVSLFTSIIVTRNILRLVVSTGIQEKLPWLFLDSSKRNKA